MMRPSCVRLCVALLAIEAAADRDTETPESWTFNSAVTEAASAPTDLHVEGVKIPRAEDFKPLLSNAAPVQVAKERAVWGICLLHTNAVRLRGVFQTLDRNADGKLDSSTEVPAEGDGQDQHVLHIDMQQWLDMTLPEPSTFCSAALADHLCDSVQAWRQQISQGVTPDEFLTLCGNEDSPEPRAKESEPAPIVITGDSNDLEPRAEESEPASMLITGDFEDSLEPRAQESELPPMLITGDFEDSPEPLAQESEPPPMLITGGEGANASFLDKGTRSLTTSEKKVGNQIAWAAIMKGINKLMIADYCYRDVWSRGVAERVCKSGWSVGRSGLDAGLCYQNCGSGRYRFGDHCWKKCPSNMNDIGTYCQREYWGKCCVNLPFIGRKCSGCPKVQTKSKDPKHMPGCSKTSSRCTTCPSGHYSHGALCYKHAKRNYKCNGAELTCLRKCTAPLAYECGAACALDRASCRSNVIDTVVGITEAVAQSVALVVSFGTSSAATAMTATTKAAMKAAAKKSAKRVAVRAAKGQFKKEVKKSGKKVIKQTIKDNMKDKIEQKIADKLIGYATSNSDSLIDAYIKQAKQNGESPELVVVKDLDPTGLANAIDGSVDGAKDHVQAANWLNVFSTVDPTGVLGAVAGVIKHSHCESVFAEMQAIEDSDISVPALKKSCADDIQVKGARYWLQGSWKRMDATQGDRPIYKKGSYYLYYWAAWRQWRIGRNHKSSSALVTSPREEAACPNVNTFWYEWRTFRRRRYRGYWRRNNAVTVKEK